MTLATIALLAQLSRPCDPRSAENGTLYVPRNGSIVCMEWDQARCAYVERPCEYAELTTLCRLVPPSCVFTQPKRAIKPAKGRR